MSHELKRGNISYCPGHPWYYVLGGEALSLKEIWTLMQEPDEYGNLKNNIEKASGKNEKLRELRT